MLKNKNILIWTGAPIERTSIEANLSKTLAGFNRVFYIENPESLIRAVYHQGMRDWWKSVLRLFSRQRLRKQGENLTVYVLRKIPFLFITYPECIRTLVLRINIRFVKRYLKQLGFKTEICMIFYPTSYEVMNSFNSDIRIYYCVDEYAAQPQYEQFPKVRTHIRRLEEKALRGADIVLFSSKVLYRRKEDKFRKGAVLRNAINTARFHEKTPSGLSNDKGRIPEPVIGFIGGINRRLDWIMLTEAARALKDYSFVFVGGGDAVTPERIRIPNFFFLPEVRPEDAPHIIMQFSVGIVPYVINTFTEAIVPAKIYEYLAAGLPIISTPLPDILEISEESGPGLFYIADSSDSFVRALQQALREDSEELRLKRKKVAALNSWSNRTEQFSGIISELTKM